MERRTDFPKDGEVRQSAINSGNLVATPVGAKARSAEEHASRVAYLAVNGWQDAIDIDVGVPGMCGDGEPNVLDGHHRIAAAIFRRDATIEVSIIGDEDYAAEVHFTSSRR